MFYGQPMVNGQTHAQLGMNELVTPKFAYVAAICTVDVHVAVRAGLSGRT
jgi:hypothetical protein